MSSIWELCVCIWIEVNCRANVMGGHLSFLTSCSVSCFIKDYLDPCPSSSRCCLKSFFNTGLLQCLRPLTLSLNFGKVRHIFWHFLLQKMTLEEKGKQLQTNSYKVSKSRYTWLGYPQARGGAGLATEVKLTRNDPGRCRLRKSCDKDTEIKATGHFCGIPGRKAHRLEIIPI